MPALATTASAPPEFLAPTAALVVAAALIGYLSVRVRVVPIVGFLLAGVVIGPAQLHLVGPGAVAAAAEIGVILLLFTIGIEFSLQRLVRIMGYVLLGGGLQVALTSALTTGVLAVAGVGWREGLFTGFLVALSSTAIVLKVVADAGEGTSPRGQLALAMLVFQDLAVILMVLVVPLLGSGTGAGGTPTLLLALGKAGAIIALVLVLARQVMPRVLERVARTCSPEVFLLTVLAICLGTAYLTALAGVSVSLGAFLAGLVVSESRHSAHVFGEIMPLQILFSAVFFVSVGMLLDLGFVAGHLPLLLGLVALVVAVKVLAATVAGLALRVGGGTALGTGLVLAQVGEFSFVLETAGRQSGLSAFGLDGDGSQALIASTVLLMVATPALAFAGRRAESRLGMRPRVPLTGAVPATTSGQARHIVVSGWGDAARALALDLRERGVALVVTTLNPDGAAEAEADGHRVVRGDPTKLPVLHAAGVPAAHVVVIAEDEPEVAARIASVVRGVSPARIVVRPVGAADTATLHELWVAGVDKVVDRDRSSHRELSRSVLHDAATGVDTSALVHYAVPADSSCPHGGLSVTVLPSAEGCEECLRSGDEWVHLRLCLQCGHVGCCDSSPNRHARAHMQTEDHPLIASLEPGETWAYCFYDDTTFSAPASRATGGAYDTRRPRERT